MRDLPPRLLLAQLAAEASAALDALSPACDVAAPAACLRVVAAWLRGEAGVDWYALERARCDAWDAWPLPHSRSRSLGYRATAAVTCLALAATRSISDARDGCSIAQRLWDASRTAGAIGRAARLLRALQRRRVARAAA